MPRYIDKDEALKNVSWDTEAYQSINMIPTADVIEVVRCKDCKYWDTTWKTRADFHYYCPMIDSVTDGDFYCADGERRDT